MAQKLEIVTFKPLSRNRYKCNQTGVIVKGPRVQAYKNSLVQRPKLIKTKNKKTKLEERRNSPFGLSWHHYY